MTSEGGGGTGDHVLEEGGGGGEVGFTLCKEMGKVRFGLKLCELSTNRGLTNTSCFYSLASSGSITVVFVGFCIQPSLSVRSCPRPRSWVQARMTLYDAWLPIAIQHLLLGH